MCFNNNYLYLGIKILSDMKNIFLFVALSLSFSGYSKAIPSPSVLFALSERIINEAQNLIFPSKDLKVKKKVEEKEREVLSTPNDDADVWLWNPVEIKRDGMWIVSI